MSSKDELPIGLIFMTFLIAETFTDSLALLTGEEQKAVKTTAFDLQLSTIAGGTRNPHPGPLPEGEGVSTIH